MASLFIEDPETAEAVARVARRMGTSETDVVRQAVRKVEDELDHGERVATMRERLEKHWREHPLPPPTGVKADKAFFDRLWGEEDD